MEQKDVKQREKKKGIDDNFVERRSSSYESRRRECQPEELLAERDRRGSESTDTETARVKLTGEWNEQTNG